ncbi:MAG: glycine zipper 2TM domain-containing protein [Proteobacteria bacterium]|nr:glycine zipper 2TM domain-containing protein [Pseudomonadota bacterium]HQR02689.1 glycine zipper 2TM domain-containing protein [Rhodocyclaceae bacterium]
METPAPTPARQGLHPALWVAAIAVTLFALAGIGSLTGLLPKKSEPEPASPVAVAPPPPAAPATTATPVPPTPMETTTTTTTTTQTPVTHAAEKPAVERRPVKRVERASAERAMAVAPPPTPAPAPFVAPPPPPCRDCGIIESVRQMTREGEGSGLGAVAGGVVGGLLGNGIGQGTGRDLATIAGVVGGAFAGNKIEKSQRESTYWQTSVRFDDGTRKVVNSDTQPAWRTGDPVRVVNGEIRVR